MPLKRQEIQAGTGPKHFAFFNTSTSTSSGHKKNHSKQFLFINERTPETTLFNYKDPRLKLAVNRHVQHRRVKDSQRGKLAPKQRCLNRSHETSGATKDSSRKLWSEKRYIEPDVQEATSEHDDSNLSGGHQIATESSKTQSSPSRIIASDVMNNLAVTSLSLDHQSWRMLQYFTIAWKPRACLCDAGTPLCSYPEERATRSWSRHVSISVGEIFQNCLADDTHMYAVLASCAGRLKYVGNASPVGLNPPEYYLAKAIRLLRRHLDLYQKIEQQILHDIFFMYTVEYFARNIETARSYLRVLGSMIKTLGGFTHLDTYAQRLFWLGDMNLAILSGCQPILPCLGDYTMQLIHILRLSNITSKTPQITRLGKSFYHHEDIMTPELRVCVRNLISYARKVQQASAANLLEHQQIMFEHSVTLAYHLLSLPPPSPDCSLPEQRQECLRQALLLWTDHVLICANNECVKTSGVNSWRSRRSIAYRLKKAICRADELSCTSWEPHGDLLLWMVGLGTSVAGKGEDREWFENKFEHTAVKLDVRSVKHLTSLFRGYLYLDSIEGPDLARLERLLLN